MKVIILITFATFAVYLGLSSLRIQHIQCYSDQKPCTNYQQGLIDNLFLNQPILFSDLTDQKSSIPWKIISFTKKLPTTLKIQIDSQQLNIQLESAGEYWTLTDNGNLIASEKKDLPLVIIDRELLSTLNKDKFPLELVSQLNWLASWTRNNEQVSPEFSWMEENTIELKTNTWPKVLLHPYSLEQDLSHLDAIIASLNIESFDQPISHIDLRFNLPVLVPKYANSFIDQSNVNETLEPKLATDSADTVSTVSQ